MKPESGPRCGTARIRRIRAYLQALQFVQANRSVLDLTWATPGAVRASLKRTAFTR